MIAAAPLATADTHHIVKGAQGPKASAVTWDYVPTELGIWTGQIKNTGLRSLVVDVFDNGADVLTSISHQRIRFAAYDAYPNGDVTSAGVIMNPTHKYVITVTPNGPRDSYCDVEDMFDPAISPVAVIDVTSQVDLTVTVSGSLSYDPDGSIMSYAWAFGDGGVATGVAATHTYLLPGTYDITLVVVDNDGLTGTDVQPVTVSKEFIPPIASFTATMNFMTASVDASASYDPDGTTLTYAWDFGDLTTGVGKTAMHTYTAEGVYTITLTVTDADLLTGSASAQVTAILPVPPVAMFTVMATYLDVAVDASGSYDPDGTIASYAWAFGDGGLATGKTATHTYAADGTYTITLTVTDGEGLTGTHVEPVTVKHELIPPVALFTASMKYMVVSVDASASYDPDSQWGPIKSYAWNFGDMTTDVGKTATHTYSAEGLYVINLVVTDADSLTTSATPQEVRAVMPLPPVVTFSVVVTDLSVAVDATGSIDPDGTIVSYGWTFGDGGVATGVTATHAYLADGTYTITLKATDNDGLWTTSTKSVTVAKDYPPTAFFTVSVSGLTVNVDASLSTDDHGIVSYVWNWGDGTTGTGKITSHTYTAPAPAPYFQSMVSGRIALGPVPPPYSVIGFTKDASGAALTDCLMTVKNMRTGESSTTMSDSVYGFYNIDIGDVTAYPSSYLVGDLIKVTAEKGTLIGSTEGNVNAEAYVQLDVTLTGGTPLPFDRTITLTVTDIKGQTSTFSVKVTLVP